MTDPGSIVPLHVQSRTRYNGSGISSIQWLSSRMLKSHLFRVSTWGDDYDTPQI